MSGINGNHQPPPRHNVVVGEIIGREDDSTMGVIIRVRLPDAREIDCRPCFPGTNGTHGTYDPFPSSGQVRVDLPFGSEASAVATLGVPHEGAPVPSDYDGSTTVLYGPHAHRSDAGATVEGVLLRPLLDDLSALVGALQAVLTTLTNPLTPPGTEAQNAAILTALRTLADLPATGIKAILNPVKSNIDASKAGRGTAPHCSGAYRMQAGS